MPVIRLHADLPLAPDVAWTLITGGEHITAWWGDHVSLDARMGGRFVEYWRDGNRDVVTSGTVTRFEPPDCLELTWADDDWPHQTRVAITVASAGPGSRVVLQHDGWEAFPEEQASRLQQAHEAGWRHHLASLARFAGTF